VEPPTAWSFAPLPQETGTKEAGRMREVIGTLVLVLAIFLLLVYTAVVSMVRQ